MNEVLKDLIERYPCLETCTDDIMEATKVIASSFRQDGKLLLCGNGGSAADAEHWSGELLKGFCHKRPLNAEQKSGLNQMLGDNLQNALPAIPLGCFSCLSTAFANDVEPELIYAQLVWALGKTNDVLVGISTSGNAANINAAFQAARKKNVTCIALTGKGGGKLKQSGNCSVCIEVPQVETYLVQELHLPVYHAICLMLENDFFT